MSRLTTTEVRREGEGYQSVISFLLRRRHYRGPRGRAREDDEDEEKNIGKKNKRRGGRGGERGWWHNGGGGGKGGTGKEGDVAAVSFFIIKKPSFKAINYISIHFCLRDDWYTSKRFIKKKFPLFGLGKLTDTGSFVRNNA